MKKLKKLTWNKLKPIEHIFFDFDGVFTDNYVIISEEGIEHVKCSRLDGIGLKRLRDIGVSCLVVSSESNKVVRARCEKLDIECAQNVPDKEKFIEDYCREHSIRIDRCAFVGNDINDLGALSVVGFPIVVADAVKDIQNVDFFVTTRNGGKGAVREVCDFVANGRLA